MKFLVDAQLPPKLREIIHKNGLESIHVDSLPKGDETADKDISLYANKNNLIINTKDSDFYHTHMISAEPKKLLLITTGNIKNNSLFTLFRNNILKIRDLFESCNFVELSNDSIIGHE